jgi:transcriptional regulator with XRE-family HTH domain
MARRHITARNKSKAKKKRGLTVHDILAMNIKTYRKHRNLKQQDLAKASGCNQATISNIEKGRRDTSVQLLAKIAKALDVPISLLFTQPNTP